MSESDLKTCVLRLVTKVANGDFDGLVAECSSSRLSGDDVRMVLTDYGKTFTPPPTEAYRELDAVPVQGAKLPTWSVRAPLWTKEEGRSDLELQLTISVRGDQKIVELDDLRVP